jgi:phage shock protein A
LLLLKNKSKLSFRGLAMAEFFDRMGRLVRAEMTDSSLRQDPKEIIEEALNEMQQGLEQLRLAIFRINKNQDQLELKLKQAEAEAASWKQRADLAAAKGNENLAREALDHRKSWLGTAATLTAQLKQMSDNIESLKHQQSAWEKKLADAQARKQSLVERAEKAISSSQQDVIGRMISPHAMAAFDRMEKEMARKEALDKAMAELEGRSLEEVFACTESDSNVDEELEAIKNQILGEIEANSSTENNNNFSAFSEDDELKKLKEQLDQL